MAGTRTCIAASAVLPMPPNKDAPRGGSGKTARVTVIGEEDKLRHGRGQAMPKGLIEAFSFLLGDKRDFSVPRTGAWHRTSPMVLPSHLPYLHVIIRQLAFTILFGMRLVPDTLEKPLDRDDYST